MTNFKREINKHLKAFDKVELVDSYWEDQAVYVLEKLPEVKNKMDEIGLVHLTKTGYTAKNGYIQAFESLLKSFAAISIKLGLSPKDREK